MSLASRAAQYLRDEGLSSTIRRTERYFRNRLIPEPVDPLFKHRKILGDQIYERFGGVVQEGALKGFRLSENPKWSAADRGTMILGLYEHRVLAKLVEFGGSNKTLIDIGAADGYFGVGCVAVGIYAQSICFELDAAMRGALQLTAKRNGVSDRLFISGAATQQSVCAEFERSGLDPAECVILCDIEGGEFDLLGDDILAKLSQASFVIELHDKAVENGDTKLDALIERAGKFFRTAIFDGGSRNPYDIPILRDFRDDDRWLLCSEGRNIYQTWLVLRPLK